MEGIKKEGTAEPQVVSFRCILRNKLGHVISSTFNQDVINQLEEGTTKLRGLVAGLQNLKAGEKRQIFVPASEAYGFYDPNLIVEVPRLELHHGKELQIGSQIATRSLHDGHTRIFRVISAGEDHVVLDGNPLLAGQDLIFDIEVTAARAASPEDWEQAMENPEKVAAKENPRQKLQ